MADTKEKTRRITVVDKDGSTTEMLNFVKDTLQETQTVLDLDDSKEIKFLIISAYNKYKREKPVKVHNLENLFA